MPIVTGIRFKDSGKTYHFDPQELLLAAGEWVVVETVRGPELGRVATPPVELAQEQLFGELKPVLRRATEDDLTQLQHLQQYEDEALHTCAQKVLDHNLPMNLIKAEYNFDGSRLTFYFTAEKRVDFRALVRDLARTFRTRIELRQIGPRDEAKLLGGIGPCGRQLCCSTFLPDFARVSIKMAKDQDLPLTPSKISGVCGRLLCCLSYEHEQYLEIKAELPERGDWVQTPHGPGEVVAVNVVKENVTVELADGNTVECTATQILDVRRRVAAEAQARNAQGITPVSHQYGLPQIDAADDLLAGDDPHILHALEELDEAPVRQARALRQASKPKPAPVRPDEALGASVTQALRPTPPRAPRTEQPQPPRQYSEQRANADQQADSAPAAPMPDASAADLAAQQNARRRKRRKRNGKV
jgi:cell fate regulator YaaT (PSP1 superfamily)